MASVIKVSEILHPTANVPSLTINSDSTVSFDAGILNVTGPINGVIGANTPYSGTFTNLSYSGTLTGNTGIINIGSGQIYKDVNGQIGIGTSSPGYRLDVAAGDTTANFGYAIRLRSNATATAATLQFTNSGVTTENGYIRVTDTGLMSLSNKAYITSAGDVGIGTASPTSVSGYTALNIKGTNGGELQLGNTAGTVQATFWADANGITYTNYAATSHIWVTAASEKMRINSSGNVGIGTTAGTTTVSSGLAINNATAANYPGLEIQTAGVTRLYFNANNAESYITSVSTNPLVILTNGSERMRINSSGNIGIGTTTTTYRTNIVYTNSAGGVAETGLYLRNTSTGNSTQMLFDGHRSYSLLVQGSFGAPAGGFTIQDNTAGVARLSIDSSGNLLVGATSTTWTNSDAVMLAVGNGDSSFLHSSVRGDGSRFIWFVYNTNHIGSIAQTGTTSVSYLTTSDYRLKENVAPMTGALATVAALKPVTYNWKVDGSDGQGFIAHELQAVVPDCVTGTKDAIDAEGKPQYQGVDTSFLVATLTAAIQELKSIIDQQDARIKTLEGNV